MKQTITTLSILLLIFSCDRISNNSSYIEPDNEYLPPSTTPLKFTNPKPFTWLNSSANKSLPDPVFIDIERLPKEPLDLLDFKPFKTPVTQKDFDFETLPSDYFDIDSLPEEKLKYTLSALSNPTVINTPQPEIKDSAQTNILVIDDLEFSSAINDLLIDDQGDTWIATNEGLYHFAGDKCYQYGTEQGLKSITIRKIIQDEKGRLWLGTSMGIIILDTKSGLIKTITKDEGLGQNDVTSILLVNKDEVWVGTYDGGIDIINETNTSIKHLTYRQKISENYILNMMKDSKGRIWVGTTSGGVDIIDIDKNWIRHCKYSTGLNDNAVYGLFESEPGVIWISSGEFVNIMDLNQSKMSLLNIDPGINMSYVNAYYKDIKGYIWLASNKGLSIVDLKNSRYKNIISSNDLLNKRFICIKKNKNNKIWIGTNEGINIVDEIQKVTYINKKKDISAEQFGQQIEDQNGNIWISTDKGVSIISPDLKSKRFLKIFGGIAFIFEDSRGKIWMAGYASQGLFIYDKKMKTLRNFNITHGLADNLLLPAIEDKSGKIWCTFPENGGIMTIHVDDFKMQTLNLKTSLIGKPALGFLEKENGDIWMSTAGKGIICLDTKAGVYREINDTTGLKTKFVSQLKSDKNNKIWFGSDNGIGIIDESASVITHFNAEQGFVDKEIATILFNKNNTLLFSTKGVTELVSSDSSFKDDPKRIIKKYSKFRGFPASQFFNIPFYSKSGALWCSDMSRISIIQPDGTDTLHHQTYITGIDVINAPQYFNDKSRFQEEINNAKASGIKTDSLLRYKNGAQDEDEIAQKNEIKWNGVDGKFNLPLDLRLPYYQNYLAFHFSGTEDGNFDKKVYRYMLKGADQKWSTPSEKSVSKSYLNLPHGRYTFQVVSKGFDGRWSAPSEFTFTILPPWWKTWWAYVLYMIGFSALTYVFSIYRSRQLIRANTLLEEKVKLRTKALDESISELKSTQSQLIQSEKMASLGELTAGIAHEIQNPLNFVNNFSDVSNELIEEMNQELDKGDITEAKAIAADVQQNLEKISHHGKRAADIVKGMLQHSRSNSGTKEPTDINVLTDEYLRLAYHGLRAKDKSFNASMDTNFDTNLPKINVVSQDIGRVILNLITNAFYAVNDRSKKGEPGYAPKVTVSTKRVATPSGAPGEQSKYESILISVSDNGSGIPEAIKDKIFQPFFTTKPTGQGTGLGLSLAYDIIKAHEGELKVETVDGEGSTFIIQLPFVNMLD